LDHLPLEISAEQLKALRELQKKKRSPSTSPATLSVLLAADDEVLAPEAALKRFGKRRCTVIENGGHRFDRGLVQLERELRHFLDQDSSERT